MATYRYGNRYLSEDEYRKAMRRVWMVGLFIVGAAIAGFATRHQVVGLEWPKWLKLATVVLAATSFGGLLAALYRQVRVLLASMFIGGLVFFFGLWIWESL